MECDEGNLLVPAPMGDTMTAETVTPTETWYDDAGRRIIELACRAPSLHNTQPWSWRITATGLELYADYSRQLPAADPQRRGLLMSCGAVLHHAQVAARALGWEPVVTRMPAGPDSPMLAVIEMRPGVPSRTADADLRAIAERFTDHRRFTSWPISRERLTALAAVASEWGPWAVPVVDAPARFQARLLVGRALDRHAADPRVAAERQRWGRGSRPEERPSADEEPVLRGAEVDAPLDELEVPDGLIALGGDRDDPESWLRTGEGLSALWLRATREGLSVVPLSPVVELDETREAFRVKVLGGLAYPHLLVRIGWQSISRRSLLPTPRRPVDDVLR